ncbi:metallophosphoesterase family protein [Corynebacterium flavescens]
MTRVTALADIHLGLPAAPGLEWALGAVKQATAEGSQLIVFAGDLVDRKYATDEVVGEAEKLLRSAVATGIPVLLLWGNHDVTAELPLRLPAIEGLNIAPANAALSLRVGSLTVHAISVAHDPDPRKVIGLFPPAQPGRNLGVLHTSLTGEFSRKPCLPTTIEELGTRGYDRWVLGHVHRPLAVGGSISWVGMGNVAVLDI